jgi:hypothetical protein
MELIGIFLVASALLVLAGAAKVARPDDTARALAVLASRPYGPRWRWLVRAGALAEAAVGIAALAAPRPITAALVAASYAAFSGVVVLARRRGGPLATCGCFGRPDTPPTLVHLCLNVVFAGSALVVAVSSPAAGTLGSDLVTQPGAGIPLVFVSAVGVWLSLLAMSALGALEGARRLVRSSSRP